MTNRQLLIACPLFFGFTMEETLAALSYLGAQERSLLYGEKAEYNPDTANCILLLSGTLALFRNHTRIATINAGDFYGVEELLSPGSEALLTLLAEDDCIFLSLSATPLLLPPAAGINHSLRDALQRNLFRMKAKSHHLLKQRLYCISARKIRDRILRFLQEEKRRFGSRIFPLTMTHKELASYLAVNRAALSAELSKMKKERILTYDEDNLHLLIDD